MWQPLWPDCPVDEVPIGHVTNGVHARTWLAPEVGELLRAHGVRPEAPPAEEHWDGALAVSHDDLWRVHGERKRALVRFLARRVCHPRSPIDPEGLTIGFARRFATYKRADLLLSPPERLFRLLGDHERPLQILVAGKAHPADVQGKDLIRRVVEVGRDPRAHGRIVFVEDYDLVLARHLVQAADVWLNTPRRPLEASGTSGMKAAMNGALNCSILDGWWAEGYSPDVGWAIDGGEGDEATQDERDCDALYVLLEQEIVPLFYDRGEAALPGRWVEMMKSSIARLGAAFNTHRMVSEYVTRLYLPAHRSVAELERAA
jgi:starch phosphorylase